MFEVTPQPGSPKPGTERPHYTAEHLAEEAAPGSGSLLPDRSCIGRRGSRTVSAGNWSDLSLAFAGTPQKALRDAMWIF